MPSPHGDVAGPEQEEGLGRRVRRFVETELGRALDKGERRAGTDSSEREDREQMSSAEMDQPRASHAPHETPVMHPDPLGTPPTTSGDADRDVGQAQVPEQPVRHEEPGARPPSGESSSQETSAERVGLLNDIASLREQWRGIQGAFVDDPQQAVDEAGLLVDRMIDEIRTNVGSARRSESMSTEDLRVSFKRYREFFERLLSA